MDYTLVGFVFHFEQNEDGLVTAITNPDLYVGPFKVYPAETLTIEPAITVEAAKEAVGSLLHAFAIV